MSHSEDNKPLSFSLPENFDVSKVYNTSIEEISQVREVKPQR